MTSPVPPPPAPVAATRDDAVVRAASEVVGGPAGSHLATTTRGLVGRGLLAAVPLLVVGSSLTVALALLTREHCRRTGWASPDQFVHACYSDVPTLVATGGAAGQPPGTALLLRLLAVVTSADLPQARPAFDAAVVLAALALAVATWCTARAAGPRRTDAAFVALSPVVVTAGLVSVDLVAVAALAAALMAWARGRPLAAGVAIGVAASIRPPVVVVLLALWLGVLVREVRDDRAGDPADAEGVGGVTGDGAAPAAALASSAEAEAGGGRRLEALPAVMATVGAVVAGSVVTLLAMVSSPGLRGGSRWLDLTSGAGYGSVWLLPSLAGRTLSPHAVELLSALALVVVVLAGTAAAARTAASSVDGRPHLPVVALVLLAGALALGPSVPVQATLVVLPVAALAVPRWRDHLPWAIAEVLYATVTWLYLYALSSPDQRGAPPWMYVIVVVARLLTLGWLALAAVRRADGRSPSAGQDVPLDPLRTVGEPCGRAGRALGAAR